MSRIKDIQAKELSDEGILSVLRQNLDKPHRYDGSITALHVFDPNRLDAPPKVLLAKLRSMARRGLIFDGGSWVTLTTQMEQKRIAALAEAAP